ncbi:hypothetical protein [Streptomyces sp. NPDC048710]|uniref:hypothetical protein n=1 Tax=unclassified Streptomyces TaxID=2593676 RepID=UPI0037199667
MLAPDTGEPVAHGRAVGAGRFWPYGLDHDNEYSNTATDRHVQIVAAMVRDGL